MRFFEAPTLDTQREPLLPHKIVSGALPGATQIRIGGSENVLIDGLHQRITITTTDGSSVGIGVIPGTTSLGFFSLDSSGNLILKIELGTIFMYDFANSGRNRMQVGKLPDGTYDVAVSKDAYTVGDAIS